MTRPSGCEAVEYWAACTRSGVARLALVTGAGLALAGCGGGTRPTPAAPSTPRSPRPRRRATTDPGGPVGLRRRRPAPAGPASCTIGDLKVSLSAGEGAAGSTFYLVRLTNNSGAPAAPAGSAASRWSAPGQPADRRTGGPGREDTAHPSPSSPAPTPRRRCRSPSGANYPARKCRPVQAEGLPGLPARTRPTSVFVRSPATACRNTPVHLLKLSPYQPAG